MRTNNKRLAISLLFGKGFFCPSCSIRVFFNAQLCALGVDLAEHVGLVPGDDWTFIVLNESVVFLPYSTR